MNYVVTMNIGNASVPEAARASMRAAASRWNADFVEIMRPIGLNRHAFFQKLQLDHHLPDNSRILYLDGDVLVRRDCPSLFELVPEGHLGLSRHDHPSNGRMVSKVRGPLADFCETVGVELDAVDDYAHTGMMVFELPLHRTFFAEMNSIIDRYGFTPFWVISDQAPVSAARKKLSLRTYWLPPMFQMTGEVLWENWTAEMRFPIQHFCGDIDRWQAIPRTSWDMLGPDRKIKKTDVIRWTLGKPRTLLPERDLPLVIREFGRVRRGRIVELGSWLGGTTWWGAQCARDNYSEFCCVDRWSARKEELAEDVIYRGFTENMRDAGLDDVVRVLRRGPDEAAKEFEYNSIDLLFIAGNERYESLLGIIDAWWERIREGGSLIGWGYMASDPGGVKRAVDERFGGPDEIPPGGSSFWKKTKPAKDGAPP